MDGELLTISRYIDLLSFMVSRPLVWFHSNVGIMAYNTYTYDSLQFITALHEFGSQS